MGNRVLIGPGNDPGGHFLHLRKFLSLNSKLFRDRPETGNESTAECTPCRSSGGAVVSSRISEQRVWGSVPTLWNFFLPFVCSHLWSTHNEWELLADRQCTLLTVTCFRDNMNSRFAVFPPCFFRTVWSLICCPSSSLGRVTLNSQEKTFPAEIFTAWKIKWEMDVTAKMAWTLKLILSSTFPPHHLWTCPLLLQNHQDLKQERFFSYLQFPTVSRNLR